MAAGEGQIRELSSHQSKGKQNTDFVATGCTGEIVLGDTLDLALTRAGGTTNPL